MSNIRDLLPDMCPNRDYGGLGLYLRFLGGVKFATGTVALLPAVPLCLTWFGPQCTTWNSNYDYIEISYRYTKCSILPCASATNTSSPTTSATTPPTFCEFGTADQANVVYLINPPYALSEAHVDLACLPIDKCAPGSYTFGRDGLGGVSTFSTTQPQYPSCPSGSRAALIIIHAAISQTGVCLGLNASLSPIVPVSFDEERTEMRQ